MGPKKCEEKNSNNEQVVLTLEKQLAKLKNDSNDLSSELQNVKSEKENEERQTICLEQELEQLKNELKQSDQNKESLELESLELAERAQEALINLDRRLECAEKKHSVLESAIIKIKQGREKKKEEAKIQKESIEQSWRKKYQELEENGQKKLDEIQSNLSKETEENTKKINIITDEIKKKDKEIEKLEKKLQDQSLQITTKVISIRNDLQKERREYKQQLNAKLAFYKAEVTKLTRMNENIKRHYRDKIQTELQYDTKKLNVKTLLKNSSQSEIQNTVNKLEEFQENFKKDLSNTIKWANHYNERRRKENEKNAILYELETAANSEKNFQVNNMESLSAGKNS